jgi:hypothetical protein
MKFTEEKLESAFTELLGQEGFPHHLGITITRKPDEVLIEEDKLLIHFSSICNNRGSKKIENTKLLHICKNKSI